MTKAERALLIGTAKALMNLLFWKNVDGHSEATALCKLTEAVMAEPYADGVASGSTTCDGAQQ